MPTERISRLARRAGAVLAAVSVVFVAVAIVRESGQLANVVADADLTWLAIGTVLFVGAELGYASRWPATLGLLGFRVATVPATASFLVTQSAKFVPGSVWHAVGRVAAAGSFDVPRRAALSGLALEAGASVGAATWIGVAAGAAHRISESWSTPARFGLAAALVAGGVAAVVAAFVVARRCWPGTPPGIQIAPRLVGWHVVAWTGYAVAAAAVGAAFDVPPLVVAGAFTISWAAGFVVPGVPAGLGIREVVMTAALGRVVSTSSALAVVVSTRAVWTLVQLGLAAVAVATVGRPQLVAKEPAR